MKKLIEMTTAGTGTGDYSPPLQLMRHKLVQCPKCGGIGIDYCKRCEEENKDKEPTIYNKG